MSEGDALVGLPLLGGWEVINEDDEILILALVMGLDLLCFATSHVDDLSLGFDLIWLLFVVGESVE